MIDTPEQRIVDAAIRSRRAVRAFLPAAVARDDIEAILEVAARAPSGTNTQPWKVHVLTGAAKERLSAEVMRAYNDPELGKQHSEEYNYSTITLKSGSTPTLSGGARSVGTCIRCWA